MQYHQPDTRWEIFNCLDFETYLLHYMVKGKFHTKVPQDILDAYITIEYMIAHAFYYYPMYDEALNKMLRTMEMAVKLRCKQLNIPLYEERNKNGSIKLKKKDFNRLIQDLISKEGSSKKLNYSLEIIRELRNAHMHPDRNTFAGGMVQVAIISCVIQINTLFSDEMVFIKMYDKIKGYNDSLNSFKNKAFVFVKENISICLIHQMKIVDVFIKGQEEIISLCIQPVGVINLNDERASNFANPLAIDVKNISIIGNEIKGIDIDSGESFVICITDHPQDIKTYEDYKAYIDKINIGSYNHYNSFANSEENRISGEFRYKYYHLME
jgi:hypothetical protein